MALCKTEYLLKVVWLVARVYLMTDGLELEVWAAASVALRLVVRQALREGVPGLRCGISVASVPSP